MIGMSVKEALKRWDKVINTDEKLENDNLEAAMILETPLCESYVMNCKPHLDGKFVEDYNASKSGIGPVQLVIHHFMNSLKYQCNEKELRKNLIKSVNLLLMSYEKMNLIQGDYKIICDGTNNTTEVIDQNQLKLTYLVRECEGGEYMAYHFVMCATPISFEEVLKDNNE